MKFCWEKAQKSRPSSSSHSFFVPEGNTQSSPNKSLFARLCLFIQLLVSVSRDKEYLMPSHNQRIACYEGQPEVSTLIRDVIACMEYDRMLVQRGTRCENVGPEQLIIDCWNVVKSSLLYRLNATQAEERQEFALFNFYVNEQADAQRNRIWNNGARSIPVYGTVTGHAHGAVPVVHNHYYNGLTTTRPPHAFVRTVN